MLCDIQLDQLQLLPTIRLDGSGGTIPELVFSPNGRMLASWGGNSIMVWNLSKRAKPTSLPFHAWLEGTFASGNEYFVGCDNEAAEVWSVSARHRVRKVVFPESLDEQSLFHSPIMSVFGKQLVIATHRFVQVGSLLDEEEPEVYALPEGDEFLGVRKPRGMPLAAYFCRQGKSGRKTLRVVDIRSRKTIRTVPADACQHTILSTDGGWCLLGPDRQDRFRIWNLRKERKVCQFSFRERYWWFRAAFTQDHKYLVNKDILGVWRVADGRLVNEIHADAEWCRFQFCRARGRRIAALLSRQDGGTRRILFVDMLTGKPLGLADGHTTGDGVFSPDGRWFATISDHNYRVSTSFETLPEGTVVLTDLGALSRLSDRR